MVEENNQGGLGSMYNDDELAAPTVQRNLILKSLPGPDAPLVCKLVPDLLHGRQNGRLMEYWGIMEHGHISGIDPKTNRPITSFHICQKSLGSQQCPECDKYYEELKRMKLAGGKDTVQGKEINKVIEIIKPRKKAWLLYVTPDSDLVKAVKVPESLLNQLWGKAKTQWNEEIPSLIADMKAASMSPYELRNSTTGWLALHKTGEQLGTRYHSAIASRTEMEMLNGRPVGEKKVFISAKVSDYILNSYDLKSLPDFRKVEEGRAFTMEESVEFAKNPFITPQRIIDMFKREPSKIEDAHEAGEAQSTSVENTLAAIAGKSGLSDIDETL